MATIKLTKELFEEKVAKLGEEWKFLGDKPAIIDFWAEWCQPCKMVGPILEELSEEYKDKIDVYKLNTEEEGELAAAFGIQSIPSILFVPVNDVPQMSVGAMPKENFEKAIEDILKIKKEE